METMMNVMANEAAAMGNMGMMAMEAAMDMNNRGLDEKHEDEIRKILFADYEDIKDKVGVRLLPASVQTDVYVSAAEYGFEDLILVPYVLDLCKMDDGTANARVTNSLLEYWGVTADEVMAQGISNLDFKILSMGDMLGFPVMDVPMTVVTNESMICGASSIIAAREKLAEMFPDGYMVLPSSKHELIVVPKNISDKQGLLEMVMEINATVVAESDKLSDNVYEF